VAEAGITWGDVWSLTREVFGPGVGLVALALLWRAAKGWSDMRKDHDALKDDHEEIKKKVHTIDGQVQSARERIAGLATRDDLDRLGERVQSQIQTYFGQIIHLLKKEV
jgi:hypothetical protein